MNVEQRLARRKKLLDLFDFYLQQAYYHRTLKEDFDLIPITLWVWEDEDGQVEIR